MYRMQPQQKTHKTLTIHWALPRKLFFEADSKTQQSEHCETGISFKLNPSTALHINIPNDNGPSLFGQEYIRNIKYIL